MNNSFNTKFILVRNINIKIINFKFVIKFKFQNQATIHTISHTLLYISCDINILNCDIALNEHLPRKKKLHGGVALYQHVRTRNNCYVGHVCIILLLHNRNKFQRQTSVKLNIHVALQKKLALK